MKLAVVPARGGSKRIPRKNIKVFCGKPMVAWSIEAAKASGCFDRIIVSTDDDEIASVARQYGADVPFIRPSELANDHAATVPVVAHAIATLAEQGCQFDYACCLYATAPFVQASDLRSGLENLASNDAVDYCFSVTTFPYPIQRALAVDTQGKVGMFYPEYEATRSQDLAEAYHDAGQFYWGRIEAWLQQRPIMSGKALPVVLPRFRVQDIDTSEDWEYAEWLFKALQRR